MTSRYDGNLVTALNTKKGTVTTINAQSVTVFDRDGAGNVLLARVAAVPSNGGAGYAIGAEVFNSVNGAVYRNTGSAAVSTFTLIGTVPAGSITAAEIATDAVDTAEIKAGAVTADEIATDAVDSAEIKANAVGNAEMADNAIGSDEVTDASLKNKDFKLPKVVVYQETIAFGDFTDGLGTSGTKDLATSIPKGAVFLRAMIDNIVGFAGDTTAVATIGDGTDDDRYNTGTPDVFATADTVDAGAPSGTIYHSAAKTPKVTVTSAADFTSVNAGAMTVTLFWYQAV